MALNTETAARLPRKYPVLGHGPHLVRQPFQFLKAVREQGPVTLIKLGPKPAYVVSSHDLVWRILLTDAASFERSFLTEKIQSLFSKGFSAISGPEHVSQRRMLQSAFRQRNLVRYASLGWPISLQAAGTWRDGAQLEMTEEMSRIITKMTLRTLFATELSTELEKRLLECIPIFLAGLFRRFANPVALLERLPTPFNLRFNAALSQLHRIVHTVVLQSRERGTDNGDLLSTLQFTRDSETGEQLADDVLHDVIMNLLLAGIETTSALMSWICHLLGRFPETQERMQQEVDQVLAGGALVYEEIVKLAYTQRVVTEALRMFPPIWELPYWARHDVDLGGHRIPGGSMVLSSIYGVHHDPSVYADPERFDPDRWCPDRAEGLPRSAFIPFGVGVRKCLGESLAKLQSVVILAAAMQRWTLRPVGDGKARPVVTMAISPRSVPMTIHRRR